MSIKASHVSAASGSEPVRSRTPRWYTHPFNRSAFYRLIAACSPYIPRPARHALAYATVAALRPLLLGEYAAVGCNMAHVLANADTVVRERMVRELFCNFAYVFTDLLSLNRQALPVQERYVHRVHGRERLQELLTSPRGFVAATAHVGNWELGGRLLSAYAGRTVNVLMAPERDAAIQRLLRERGNLSGLRFVTNESAGAFMQLLMALRRGDIVAIQVDRGVGHRRDVPVTFFGAPVLFPSGPFVLAAAVQVPVLPCFCLMRPDRQYAIFIDEPIIVRRGHEEAALQQMAGVLERYVAMAPNQWFNFYDIWNNTVA